MPPTLGRGHNKWMALLMTVQHMLFSAYCVQWTSSSELSQRWFDFLTLVTTLGSNIHVAYEWMNEWLIHRQFVLYTITSTHLFRAMCVFGGRAEGHGRWPGQVGRQRQVTTRWRSTHGVVSSTEAVRRASTTVHSLPSFWGQNDEASLAALSVYNSRLA